MSLWNQFLKYRRSIIIFGTLLVFLPVIFVYQTRAAKCAYVLFVMAAFWLTEVIPLGVTSLLPVVLFPILGVRESNKVSPNYMKDTNMLFMGGLIVALAVEHHNLHKRIALAILLRISPEPKWLLLGFMVPTWILSMWISNTATTAMMLPIVNALMQELLKQQQSRDLSELHVSNVSNVSNTMIDLHSMEKEPNSGPNCTCSEETCVEVHYKEAPPAADQPMPTAMKEMYKAMNLCVAYASTCGGMATLTGTAPNLILHGFILKRYGNNANLNFGTWMVFALPISISCLLMCWMWLLLVFWGPRGFKSSMTNMEKQRVISIFRSEYAKLGPMKFTEKSCALFLALLALLWITKEPGFEGWIALLKYNGIKYCSDATPALLIAVLMMMWPAKSPFNKKPYLPNESHVLLPWNVVQSNFPLGIILLIGGGFALADACENSGLSDLVGGYLSVLQHLPKFVLILLLCLASASLTEVTSSSAVTTIVLTMIAPLADCMGLNPLFLLIPTTLACTFAFCLPVATPPNAIVFSQGHVRVIDMVKAGFLMNLGAIAVTMLATFTYGNAYFRFFEIPEWSVPCKSALVNQTTTVYA